MSTNIKEFVPVIIEVPFVDYKTKTLIGKVITRARKLKYMAYAILCMKDAIFNHNEAPIIKHILYHKDSLIHSHSLEKDVMAAWRKVVKKTVVYLDYGMSPNMSDGLDYAELLDHEVEYRFLWPPTQKVK